MYRKEVLEKMSDEEITEEIDKTICSIADRIKPEWKEEMMKWHQRSLQEDEWFNRAIRCAPILCNLLFLENCISDLRQLMNEENHRTSKEDEMKNMFKEIESE